MIVAEFTVDSPILREVLHSGPDIEIRWETTYPRPDGSVQLLVWITCDEFEAVETALEADPSVRSSTRLADQGGRRLYRVTLTESEHGAVMMPRFVEVGAVLEEAIGTDEGWWCRVRFPKREAFQRIHRFCRDQDIEFEFGRVFELATDGYGVNPLPSMLTERQWETLRIAWEEGYFEVPRRITLAALAEKFGISDTAVSQRLRRAHASICAYLFGVETRSINPVPIG